MLTHLKSRSKEKDLRGSLLTKSSQQLVKKYQFLFGRKPLFRMAIFVQEIDFETCIFIFFTLRTPVQCL